jgi:hypothetical protein
LRQILTDQPCQIFSGRNLLLWKAGHVLIEENNIVGFPLPDNGPVGFFASMATCGFGAPENVIEPQNGFVALELRRMVVDHQNAQWALHGV